MQMFYFAGMAQWCMRALASHQCGPGSIPRSAASNVGWVCWFSTLHREVFSRNSGFPSPQKKQNLTSLCQLLISVAVSLISAPALERLDNGKAKAMRFHWGSMYMSKGLVIDASNVGILSRRKIPHLCTNVKEKINSFMLYRTWTCHSNTWPCK